MGRKIKERTKVPLLVICTEGNKRSSEIAYFNNFKNRNLRIEYVDGEETDPEGMLNNTLKFLEKIDAKYEDELHVFLVLDTDCNMDRIKKIKLLEEKCQKSKIEIITSSPTFEIWFLMHTRSNNLNFTSSSEVKKETKKVFSNYKEGVDIYKEIKDKTSIAIINAKRFEKESIYENIYEKNPHSKIYKVIETIEDIRERYTI